MELSIIPIILYLFLPRVNATESTSHNFYIFFAENYKKGLKRIQKWSRNSGRRNFNLAKKSRQDGSPGMP